MDGLLFKTKTKNSKQSLQGWNHYVGPYSLLKIDSSWIIPSQSKVLIN